VLDRVDDEVPVGHRSLDLTDPLLQLDETIGRGVECGDHDHRPVVVSGPQAQRDLESVDPGQQDVEDERGVGTGRKPHRFLLTSPTGGSALAIRCYVLAL
jgi:hypothetical protein